jgi:hypothetical protein
MEGLPNKNKTAVLITRQPSYIYSVHNFNSVFEKACTTVTLLSQAAVTVKSQVFYNCVICSLNPHSVFFSSNGILLLTIHSALSKQSQAFHTFRLTFLL